jgi:hypothetical protein
VLASLYRSQPWNLRALVTLFVLGNVLYLHPGSHDLREPARLLVSDVLARLTGALPPASLTPLPRRTLVVTSNHEVRRAHLAADGNMETSWATDGPQAPGVYVQVDLGRVYPVIGFSLWSTSDNYPRGYAAEASTDGAVWTRVSEGNGHHHFVGFFDEMPRLFVGFATTSVRYLRISPTRRDPARWAIQEMAVYVASVPW